MNDADCAEVVLSVAKTILPGGLVGPPTPNMAGEDFAFFLSRKVLYDYDLDGFILAHNIPRPFKLGFCDLPAEVFLALLWTKLVN